MILKNSPEFVQYLYIFVHVPINLINVDCISYVTTCKQRKTRFCKSNLGEFVQEVEDIQSMKTYVIHTVRSRETRN